MRLLIKVGELLPPFDEWLLNPPIDFESDEAAMEWVNSKDLEGKYEIIEVIKIKDNDLRNQPVN